MLLHGPGRLGDISKMSSADQLCELMFDGALRPR